MLSVAPGRPSVSAIVSRPWVTLGVLMALGALPRLAAIRYNIWPHGDVVLDMAIAESLAFTGRLLVPFVDVRYYPTSQFGFGYPPDQHPPLWPLLGASLTPIVRNGYLALQMWSFIAGLLVIPLGYLAFRRAVGTGGALWIAGLVTISFILIDFSGNGSLWILLTALYLLFVWTLDRGDLTPPRAVAAGLIIGLAFLVNYPGVVLAPAFLLTLVLQQGSRVRAWASLRGIAIAGLVALAAVLPWFAFNASLHGNPLWSQPLQRQLGGGDKGVDVRVVAGEVIKVNRPEAGTTESRLRTTASNLYGNVGFVLRQMLVLAPVLNAFALAALIALALPLFRLAPMASPREWQALAPVVAVLLCHGALALLWPTTKFRYLVPVIPLVLGLGTWMLCTVEPRRLRMLLGVVSTLAVVVTSVWTWAVIPSRTYYYNGGVVTDNFGQQGETVWVADARAIATASELIRQRGPGTVLGDHLFYALARQPLVINAASYSREALETLVRRYEVRYVWLDRARADEVQNWLGGARISEPGRFVLLDLSESR